MASLDVIRTLTMRAKAEGFAQAEQAVKSLGTSTETSARRQMSMEQGLQKLERQFISTAKQTQDFERVQRQLNMVLAANPALQDRVNTVLEAAALRLGQVKGAADKVVAGMSSVNDASRIMVAGMSAVGAAVDKTTKSLSQLAAESTAASNAMVAGMSKIGKATLDSSVATQKLTAGLTAAGQDAALPKQLDRIAQGMTDATKASGLMIQGMSAFGRQTAATAKTNDQWASSTKASRFELLNLSRQLQDVGVSLASGQNPFIVLTQQGSQIFDAFQSASASGRSLGTAILGLITPMRVLAVGTLAAVAATVLLYTSWKTAELQALALSERLDVTIKQLDSLQAVAAITGIDDQAFQKGIAGFGDQVNLAKKGLGDLAELMRVNGKSAGNLEESLFKVADLVKNAATGADKYRIAQAAGLPATSEWIRLLSKGGDALREARNEADSFGGVADDSLIKRARDFDEAWNKAWANFKLTAKDVLQSVFGWLLELVDSAGNLIKGVLGSATTRGDELGPLKVTVNKPTQLPADVKATNDLERQHIQLLGNLATEEEKVRLKQLEINDAVQKGVGFRAGEIDKIMEVAKLQERANRSASTVSALGDAATAAEKYASQVDALRVKLADTTLTQDQFNRAVSQLNPTIIAVKDASSELGNAMARAFINGQSAADALNSSLKAVASTASSKAINSLITGLTGGGFDLPTIATGGAIALGASLLSKLFGGDAESKKAAEAAQQAMEQANKALQDVTESFRVFTSVASGPVTSSIKDAQRQFTSLNQSAKAAMDAANVIVNTAGNTAAQMAAANQSMANARQAVADAQVQLADFLQRTIEAGRVSLRGEARLTEIAQSMKNLTDQAKDLSEAMILAGSTAEQAAAAVGEDLAEGMRKLRESVENDLLRTINETVGKGFLNQVTDLFAKIKDAQALGVNPDIVAEFFSTSAQAIVDGAKLTGQAFDDLIQQFPQLNGVVHEFSESVDDATKTVTRSIDELQKSAQALEDRLFNALNDTSTLEGRLAAFDRSARREREEEQRLGGENMVLLEQTLAAERGRVIDDFNRQAVEAEKQAAKDRQDAINGAAKNIAEYLNSLVSGPQSNLSPTTRLTNAQNAFNAQLALAQSGNVAAQAGITNFAEDFRKAARDVYGSSAQFQQTQAQIMTSLASLPALAEQTDPVVKALIDTVTPAVNAVASAVGVTTTAVGGTTTAVGGTTGAVTASGNQVSDNVQTQTSVIDLIRASNASIDAQTATGVALQTSANSLQTTANSFLNSSNTFLNAINSLLTSTNSLLTAVSNQTSVLVSLDTTGLQTNYLGTLVQTLTDANNGLFRLTSVSSHMFAPNGSVNFQLAGGGFVPDGANGTTKQFKLAGGGPVGTDTVQGWLTPGEYVVRRSAAQANRSALMGLNATGHWPSAANDDDMASLLSEVRQLRRDLVTALAINAEHIRGGIDEMSDSLDGIARENTLQGQAA